MTECYQNRHLAKHTNRYNTYAFCLLLLLSGQRRTCKFLVKVAIDKLKKERERKERKKSETRMTATFCYFLLICLDLDKLRVFTIL